MYPPVHNFKYQIEWACNAHFACRVSNRACICAICLVFNCIRSMLMRKSMVCASQFQTPLLGNHFTGIKDEKQMTLMHGAKCPNSRCDNPLQIPWKVNCQLIMKPTTNGNVSNDTENGYSEDSNVVHCSECGAKVTDKQSEEFKNVMEFTELHLQNMKDASTSFVDVCLHCLDRQEGLLHPLNVMRAQTLDHAVDALIQTQLWERACGLAQLLLPCFRNYYGEKHPLTGLLHLKYGKILLFKMRILEALEQLKSAQAVLKITHGDKHPLYRQELMPLLEQALMESN